MTQQQQKTIQFWPNRDPLGEDGGLNLYGYVGNNPISQVDPYGETWGDDIGLFFDWALGLGSQYQTFGPGTSQVADMINAPGVNAARAYFRNKNQGIKNCSSLKPLTRFGARFGLKGLWQAGGNSTQQFLGRYTVYIFPQKSSTCPCRVTILIWNNTSLQSFLYGLGPAYGRGSLPTPGGNM